MAIEKIVEIKVDAKQATKSLDELGGSFEDVYGEVQPLSGRIGELEDRLYEMALAGESGTKEFKDLTKEIGSMKKVIIDTDRTVDGMSQTLAQNLGGAIGGVTSAFELGIGTVAAFGVESAKVEEALLKVQSASAIAQGFQGIRESVSSFKALGVAIRSSAIAQRAFNLVMNANPIGLIITAIAALTAGIAALIANFKSITDWLGITDNEAEKLHANNVERAQEFVKLQEKRVEAVKKEADQIGRRYDFEIEKARAAGEETFDLEQEKRRQVIESTKQEIRAVQDVLKAKIAAFQVMYGLSNEQAKLALLENKAVQGLIAQINELRVGVEETQREIVVAEIANNKKRLDENAKFGEERKAQELKQREERLRILKEEQEIATRIINGFILDNQKARQDQEIELLTLGNEKKKNVMGGFWNAVFEGNKESSEKQKKLDDEDLARKAENADKSLQMANDSLGAISGLITSFAGEGEAAQRKAFEVNKAISIGQAIISTAQGIIAQLAVPQDALTGANFIKAGIVAATGAAQIATISRTQFSGGAGTTPAAPNTPATSTSQPANFNVVGNTGTNQLADTLGSSPMKAYVVAGDVTSAQSLERNKIQQSTL